MTSRQMVATGHGSAVSNDVCEMSLVCLRGLREQLIATAVDRHDVPRVVWARLEVGP